VSVASRHTTSPCQTQAVMFRIQQSANRHHADSNLNCLSWGAYTVCVSLAVDTCHRASPFSPTGDVVRVTSMEWTPATLLLLQDLLLEVGHPYPRHGGKRRFSTTGRMQRLVQDCGERCTELQANTQRCMPHCRSHTTVQDPSRSLKIGRIL